MAKRAKLVRLDLSQNYAKHLLVLCYYNNLIRDILINDIFPELTPTQRADFYNKKVSAIRSITECIRVVTSEIRQHLTSTLGISGKAQLQEFLGHYGFYFTTHKKHRSRRQRILVRRVI